MKDKIKWTRTPPKSPDKPPSQWYWFIPDPHFYKEDQPWVVELWPGRWVKHFQGRWWPVPVEPPEIE